ncbi:MarR family winged helix-turn-helix transcriptional regulator [Corynebacterium liangguodongii]|uniref:MarR family transcriptional regulator n=1 Tax=Corynebacterium liangguodongii TaxID=2079535 RepID=A0A2S0WFX4_9CORY|nr:MarR family transcriptional regulator [Corynebacterium liangguodongii]AWB84671.1 MarR family transcriptional regulator [Corynebacterium liangguodongii]PWB99679.1 MarR family transcriptional regulator [Corynebacterium liangguodongii]
MAGTELPGALMKSPSFQIERVRRHTKDQVERALGKQGTTMREFWILTCVCEHACSQTQLAELLVIDASDMVRLIDSLERHEWVTRDRDPQDRRRQIVTPTKKGIKAQAQLAEAVAAAEDRALDMSTTKQLKSLKKLSQAILQEDEAGKAS